MNVGVAYAAKFKKVWLKLEVPDDSRVREAIEYSGLLIQFQFAMLISFQVGAVDRALGNVIAGIEKMAPLDLGYPREAGAGLSGFLHATGEDFRQRHLWTERRWGDQQNAG